MRRFTDPAWRFALQVYVPLRVALTAIAAAVRALYPGDLSPHPVLRPYLGVVAVEGGWQGLLLGVWQRWDTLWYMLIAQEGYAMHDTRIFAPPLYPWLMRLTGELLGGGSAAYLLGGLVVSNLACIAMFAYLYRLVALECNVVLARRSVVYLSLFPSAFFLISAYAESLLMLCIVASFYHARRGQWVAAGIWGFFAPLARLPGVVILLPLGWEFARQAWASRHGHRPLPWWHGWPLVLVLLGGLAFPLYAHLVIGAEGLLAPFTIHTQRFMGRFALPGESLWTAARVLATGRFRIIEPFDLASALLFIGLTIAGLRRLPVLYSLYMAVMLAGVLSKVSEVQPLLSLSRYALVLFPGFVLLARAGWRSGWRHRTIVYLSAALLVFYTGQFVIWGWVG